MTIEENVTRCHPQETMNVNTKLYLVVVKTFQSRPKTNQPKTIHVKCYMSFHVKMNRNLNILFMSVLIFWTKCNITFNHDQDKMSVPNLLACICQCVVVVMHSILIWLTCSVSQLITEVIRRSISSCLNCPRLISTITSWDICFGLTACTEPYFQPRTLHIFQGNCTFSELFTQYQELSHRHHDDDTSRLPLSDFNTSLCTECLGYLLLVRWWAERNSTKSVDIFVENHFL